ncbi:MAG: diguanylate cyclase [Desulfuromonadales bacterium]|nr:diguanylate cyclase [Desulfuromonadales bacterium]
MTMAEQNSRWTPSRANQLALLYIDVDRVKAINDSFGHETGSPRRWLPPPACIP